MPFEERTTRTITVPDINVEIVPFNAGNAGSSPPNRFYADLFDRVATHLGHEYDIDSHGGGIGIFWQDRNLDDQRWQDLARAALEDYIITVTDIDDAESRKILKVANNRLRFTPLTGLIADCYRNNRYQSCPERQFPITVAKVLGETITLKTNQSIKSGREAAKQTEESTQHCADLVLMGLRHLRIALEYRQTGIQNVENRLEELRRAGRQALTEFRRAPLFSTEI